MSGPARTTTSARPSVSVCIPVFQGRAFIARTVESVLAQTFTDFELVIRDNGSTDGTADVVTSFPDPRIRLERARSTVPLPDSFDRVLALGRADLIKLVNADDVLRPRCLELQVAAMRADEGLALTAGRVDWIDPRDRILISHRHGRHPHGRLENNEVIRRIVRHGGNPIGPPAAVLFRRADFDAVGGHVDREPFTLDIALWVRLLRRGAFLGMPDPVAGFRVRPGTVTATAGRDGYAVQRDFTTTLARDPSWTVRPRDVALGLLGAPGARLRRHALFAASALRGRVDRERSSGGPRDARSPTR